MSRNTLRKKVFTPLDPRPQVPVETWLSNLFPEDVHLVNLFTIIFYGYGAQDLRQVIDFRFSEQDLWDMDILYFDTEERILNDLRKRCCLGPTKK